MSNTIKLLNVEEFSTKDILDIIRFVESTGGQKFIKELITLQDTHKAIVDNAAWLINSQNKDNTMDQLTENRGAYTTIELLRQTFLNIESLDNTYNKLFKLDQEKLTEV